MNKKYLLVHLALFIILIISNNAYSQSCEVQNTFTDRVYSNDEICKLEKRICSLLNELNLVPEDNKINIYYIPIYELKDKLGEVLWKDKKYKKSDFVDKSILNRLYRVRPIDVNGEKYIDAQIDYLSLPNIVNFHLTLY
jgi:hypothetical protein